MKVRITFEGKFESVWKPIGKPVVVDMPVDLPALPADQTFKRTMSLGPIKAVLIARVRFEKV